jgi:dihydroxyacetone kinase
VSRACDILIAAEGKLNALDAKVGDGDTGSTVATAARHLQAALPLMPLARLDRFFAATSEALSRSMGGSSGVLLAIFFSAASQSASGGATWQNSLSAGLAKMMAYGGAKPGDRTMIDAIAPALTALSSGLDEAAKAARAGADATARMPSARAGRSTYVSSSHLEGIPDPGAEAVAMLFEGLARG